MERELKQNEPQFPGFAAEASLEKSGRHFGCEANQADGPQGVSPAGWCWDPTRQSWVIC